MQKQYKTKDIYEAAALLAKKARLASLEKTDSFYWFVFDDWDAGRTLSDSYWRNELVVLARDYSDAVRTLKDRIFANK